jgi:hypothetical protein
MCKLIFFTIVTSLNSEAMPRRIEGAVIPE